ncbi:hypothetical protein PILCRDRAFT_393233 [Piloderma croceum F 1598]|uniref:Uncharacterized protein n=1 Tax=Piloderma croceum (strain F 1598) TaxID=765440 RepID=A0A0C3BEF9_PILCF|nr:hypothetical protein PILCRDRAFT_393233 [Piloderma croceum F 1598]
MQRLYSCLTYVQMPPIYQTLQGQPRLSQQLAPLQDRMIGRNLAQDCRHCIRWTGRAALTISVLGILGWGGDSCSDNAISTGSRISGSRKRNKTEDIYRIPTNLGFLPPPKIYE